MKKIKVMAKLVNAIRLNNSYYGNPRYFAVYELSNGFLKGKTSSDGKIGYTIFNNRDSEKILTYHVTRTGNIIFDYVEEVISND